MAKAEVSQKVRQNGVVVYFEEKRLSFYPNGIVREGILADETSLIAGPDIILARKGQPVGFWEDGSLRICVPAKDTADLTAGGKPLRIHSGYQWDMSNRLGEEHFRPTLFHPGGLLREAVIAQNTVFHADDREWELEGNQPAGFHPNGVPATGYLKNALDITLENQQFRLAGGFQIFLHPDGVPHLTRLSDGNWICVYHPKAFISVVYMLENTAGILHAVSDMLLQAGERDIYLPAGTAAGSEESYSFNPEIPSFMEALKYGRETPEPRKERTAKLKS